MAGRVVERQEAVVLQHPWQGVPHQWRGLRCHSGQQLRLQWWICQLGEGVVYSQKELVLPAAEQGLRWHRSAEHGPGCHSGLRRWGATWYLRGSGCGGHWNRAALRNGPVRAAASSATVAPIAPIAEPYDCE